MKTGFFRQSFWEYIESPAINRSFLHNMISYSPGHAKYLQEHEKITEAFRVGDAFHASILEPERFEREYVILPDDCKPGTKDKPNPGMKARKEAFEVGAEGRGETIIQPADQDNIREMVAVIQADQEALDLLSGGVAEQSGYFIDPDYDSLVKIRLDLINKGHNILIDLKSCADARHAPFRKSAYDHGYDLQAFMGLLGVTQITGVPHNEFKFICVESKGYHGLHIWEADQEMLEVGYKKYQKAMILYKQCIESGEWPGYDSTPKPLGAYPYAKELKETGVYDNY